MTLTSFELNKLIHNGGAGWAQTEESGTVLRRADGKVFKSSRYTPPALRPILLGCDTTLSMSKTAPKPRR